ncbi:MFS transporter [uncultured Sphingomonas sp.]|uniref:MFS transporter n=1 Tax=uncultured Sphingomonas sp. TaxID=158754 RepID=UPI0025D95411|nr:MFS transporter [uncultured Sphingomonas sp.]
MPGVAAPSSIMRVASVVGALAIAQSIVSGIAFQALPALLRAHGAAPETLALTSLVMCPWAAKFAWAPLVERWRRPGDGRWRDRSIMLAGQATVVAAIVAIGVVGPGSVAWLVAILVTAATASATADIAVDAYAVEQTPAGRRGIATAAQVGGSYTGFVAGGGVLIVLVGIAGWAKGFLLLATLMVLLSGSALLVRRPVRRVLPPARPSLATAWRNTAVRQGIALTLVVQAGTRLAQALMPAMLVDAGIGLPGIGSLLAVGAVASGVAAVAGGWAVVRFGSTPVICLALSLQVLSIGVIASATVWDDMALRVAVIVQSVATALGTVGLYADLMGRAAGDQPGIDFTIFQCADAAGAVLLGGAALMMASRIGFDTTCMVAATVPLAALLPVTILSHIPRGDPA